MGPLRRSVLILLVLSAMPGASVRGDGLPEPVLDALEQAWEDCPFSLSAVLLVEQPAEGYGLYQPRSDNRFRPNEPVHVYIEPICYGFERDGPRYRFGMNADFRVLDTDRRVIGGQDDFGQFLFESFRKNRELKVDLNFVFSDVPPGTYVFETVLHDMTGKGSATAKVEVEFLEPVSDSAPE